jgi:hypothetical protein
MPIYNATYSRTQYFEKDYEADSYEEAHDMFHADLDKWSEYPSYTDNEMLELWEV